MAVQFKGFDKILEAMDNLVAKEEATRAIQKACALVERTAKQKAPKDTGALRNSIQSRVEQEGEDIVGIVFTPLEYAPYVEYGTGLFAEEGGRKTPWINKKKKTGKGVFTRGQKPQPYMRPALNENRERIVEILKGSGE